ncbi:hypothetical protein GCM10007863_11840 [Dyella mobilis]|nr:hypothetical protein GCM10007863_11840 [Dyella mobilis]
MGNGSSSYNCTDHSADHSASHDTSSSSGDAFNIPHGTSHSTGSSGSSRSSSTGSTDENPVRGGGNDAPSGSASHNSGLNWQSLLPGSIQ